MQIEAQRELLAPRGDVWSLLAEPRHLSDWWPGYTAIRADRRGLAEGARWDVVRGGASGLLRRPGGDGLIVVTAVETGLRFGWRDVQQAFVAEILLEPAAAGHTRATLTLQASWWRLVAEGLRPAPRQALARLHALCQTAAGL
ncbi:MAG TPA: SRPBCC family protein [Gaiellaceae bacterium]